MPSRRRPSRRRFLLSAALSAGLAGCAGNESSAPDSTTAESTATTSSTTRTTSGTTATEPTTSTTAETTVTADPATDPRQEPPESDAVRWRVAFDDSITYAPAVADGQVFVAAGDPHYGEDEPSVGSLAQLDAGDGTPRWATELPAAPTSRPRADATGVYCTTGRADGLGLHGRDQRGLGFAPDGTERWRTDPVDQFLALVALGGGRAYFGTSDDVLGLDGQTLSAIGLADGETKWSVEGGDTRAGRYHAGAAKRDETESDRGTVLTEVAGGMGVAVHDAATGRQRWAAEVSPFGAPTNPFGVVDGAAFVGIEGEREAFALLELADGSQRWRYRPETTDSFSPTGGAVGRDVAVGVEYDGNVFALDAADGSLLWRLDPGGRGGGPIVADGTAYVAGSSDDGPDALYALDAATGEELWRTTREAVGPYAAFGDRLLVTGARGSSEFVAALARSDGTERWSFETYEDLTAPVVADGSVFVASERGIVRALGE